MPDTPLVSVVMTVFNAERFLREAVDSILSQTYTEFEFIIIDDGSSDGTAAILESYARTDPRVRVYLDEHKGIVDSANRGCALARGKYIARMDADDVALPDRLARQIQFLEKHDDVGLLGSAIELIDSTGKSLGKELRPVEDWEIRTGLLHTCVIAQPSVVMRKDIFWATGGYRNFFVWAEDYELFLRLSEHCQLANLPDVLLQYRIRPGQVSSSRLRQQCLSMLAAQAFASFRREGKPEPDTYPERSTPEFLASLGVDQATQHRLFSAIYRYRVIWGLLGRDEDTFLRLLGEYVGLSKSGPIFMPSVANFMLSAARIHYHRGSFTRALAFFGRAILIRPVVVGRPLKRALTSLLGRPRRGPATAQE